MRCLNCRYDLRRLSEHRCPECGRGFDPEDPATYYVRPTIVSLRELFYVALVCYIVNFLWIAYVSLREHPDDYNALLAAPIGAALLLIFTFPIGVILYGIYWLVRRSFSK